MLKPLFKMHSYNNKADVLNKQRTPYNLKIKNKNRRTISYELQAYFEKKERSLKKEQSKPKHATMNLTNETAITKLSQRSISTSGLHICIDEIFCHLFFNVHFINVKRTV